MDTTSIKTLSAHKRSTVTGQTRDLDAALRETLRQAIGSYKDSRGHLCDKLSDRVGRVVTVGMLENWISESKWKWHLPADCVPALCDILGTDTLQRQLLSERSRELIAIGETVTQAAGSLKRAQEAVAKIVEQGHQKAKCEIR